MIFKYVLIFLIIVTCANGVCREHCNWCDEQNNVCKECRHNLYLHNGTCTTTCPNGYVKRRDKTTTLFRYHFSMVGNVCERILDDNTFLRSWGNSGVGTPPSSSLNLTFVYATNYAFAALQKNGSVIAWGREGYGGKTPASNINKNIADIYRTERAFAALKTTGKVICWGPLLDNRMAEVLPN